MNKKIQEKWKASFVVGHDCITFGDGRIVMANTYRVKDSETKEEKIHWFPLCDTTLEGIQKYEEDVWTEIDIYYGSFSCTDTKETFVFGDGAMGNEGYVASIDQNNNLNWSIFFTFSNPICKVEIIDQYLVSYGDTGVLIKIDRNELTNIQVDISSEY